MSTPSIAHYREAFNLALGVGPQNPFSVSSLDVSNDDFLKLGGAKGDRWEWKHGGHIYAFRIVRARGTIASAGIALKRYIGAAGRTGTMASSTKAVSVTADTFAENEVVDGLMITTGGTGPNQMRRIKENTTEAGASTVTVAERDNTHNAYEAIGSPEAWTTLPDATTTYSIYCGWEVVPTSGVGDVVIGVSLAAVTSGNWTIIIEGGPCQALVVGSTDATTAGGWVVPSATAGTLKGPTAAGITAVEAAGVCGQAIQVQAGAAALTAIILSRRHIV